MAATHLALGSLQSSVGSAAGDGSGGRESLGAARDLAAEIGVPGVETLASLPDLLARLTPVAAPSRVTPPYGGM